MKKARWLALGFLVACASAAESDPVRAYTDSVVELVVKQDDAALYAQFAPAYKEKVSFAQFLDAARTMRGLVGNIKTTAYQQRVISNYDSTQGRVQFSGIRYAITTDVYPDGYFLLIDVVSDGDHLHLARYSFGKEVKSLPSRTPNPVGA
jgi:hypothetical protein